MSYQQNDRNNRPAVIKPPIDAYIPVIHEMTENRWKHNEIILIWNAQPNEMPPDDFVRMMYIASKRGLDPLLRQIYASCRWSSKAGKYSTSIEATIDGFRLACDLTGEVEGMSEPEFTHTPEGQLISCKLTLWKKGCPKGFTAVAYFSEYCQNGYGGNPTDLWAKMPHQMLAKCCEALVRRMAFPAALSGIYAREEMMQADSEAPLAAQYLPQQQPQAPAPATVPVPVVTAEPPQPQAPAPVPAPQPEPEAPKRGRRKQEAPAPVAQAPVPPPPPAPVPPPPAEAPKGNMQEFEQWKEKQAPADKYTCADTGQPIVDWTDPSSNQVYNRDWIYEYSIRTLGRPLCAARLLAVKQEQTKPPASVMENKAAQILNGTAA